MRKGDSRQACWASGLLKTVLWGLRCGFEKVCRFAVLTVHYKLCRVWYPLHTQAASPLCTFHHAALQPHLCLSWFSQHQWC